MVIWATALAAAAASLPTGFGFGAGYGAGVRVGYDILYPKLAPFISKIADDLIGAVSNLWGQGGAPPPGPSSPISPGPTVPPPPTGRGRAAVDPCDGVQTKVRRLQKLIVIKFNQVKSLSDDPRNNTVRRARQDVVNNLAKELNELINNPNNRQCVEGMKF